MREIYLDNNATTRPLPEVRAAMMRALEDAWGNPSSAHRGGAAARRVLAEAREGVAGLLGAHPEQVCFVSGGTEANVMAIRSCLAASATRRLVTSTIEHSSVLKTAQQLEGQGCEVIWIPPDAGGRIDPSRVEAALRGQPRAAISIQWVNNETGVVHDVLTIGSIARQHGALFHCDAAQAAGKIPICLHELPIDYLTLTAHKLHGPAGVGALVASERRLIQPILLGGDQEAGRRPGTENIVGVAGFGTAADLRRSRFDQVVPKLAQLRDRFEHRIRAEVPAASVNGATSHRVCNTSNLQFALANGQALMAQLDVRGVRCSQSSACTNSRPEPSYVLRAMGLTEDQAYRSVRFSFSELNTPDEVEQAVELLSDIHAKIVDFEIPGASRDFREVAS